MFHEKSSISYFKFPAIHSADFAKAAQMSYGLRLKVLHSLIRCYCYRRFFVQ
jgi:hypothetical protein